MDKQKAQNLIKETFEKPFDKVKFAGFIKNLLNQVEEKTFTYQGNYIPDAYKPYITSLERLYKYSDDKHEIDILVVQLKKQTSLERARTMQRNFIAWYLNGSRGGKMKDAALVAFVSPGEADWRFSLVRMDYRFEETKDGKVKVKEEFTPARRWSFLVGSNEASHTAQNRLVNILADDEQNPTLQQLEEAFNIETVTKEFFLKYRELFIRTKEELDKVVARDDKIKADFVAKGIDTVNFAKKLLGQIVFLYFLQKKGWFGVERDAKWGTGSKHFLRELFEGKHGKYTNFFNDILEPLFYEALRNDRSHDDHYYSRFDCKIPFLNGGLFDPIGNYDWVHTDINIPNELFSNTVKTKEGDIGSGILDIFDRYNFTVKEDEPLEKEVAIDPELLGKAYEKFNAIRPDNFEEYKAALKSGQKDAENKFNKTFGVYYTPREIVHYMCKQSLINYLFTRAEETGLSNDIKKQDIEDLIEVGEMITEHEATALNKQENIKNGIQKSTEYVGLLSNSIQENAETIDNWLADITVCDPAVGSGAFPVGMMHEIVKARNLLSTFIQDPNRNIYTFKRECIEKSLYGVDIDPGAVEIAKLRLWLSLVVDEDDIRQIKPLPNLDYKIVCGNSLLGYPYRPIGLEKIEKLKEQFFNETRPNEKNKLRQKIDEAIYSLYKDTEKSLGFKVNFDFTINFSEVFHKKGGFDVVIANPPYVSTKGRNETDKNTLLKIYKFADDLYSHFYFKSIEILAPNKGILCFISSKTFWTIQSKKNLRELLLKNTILLFFDTANPFENAMVDTCVAIVKKASPHSKHNVLFFDGKTSFTEPQKYSFPQNDYANAPNKVFFIPTDLNKKIYHKYGKKVSNLLNIWWNKVSTSNNIDKYKKELDNYRKSLKPGDITLLGLITEGGVGIQTGNNGKYIAVLEGTKWAENVKIQRPEKLLLATEFCKKENIKTKADAQHFLDALSEQEIRQLFERLKDKYGRDIFGQGWLYRIVNENEIANVDLLTDDEKLNGIAGTKTNVPYDKGDKDGNRWYAPTPYYIDWSRENVKVLQTDPKSRWQGYQFYFREGFCWSDIHTVLLKCRLKINGIHDVKSMSLFTLLNNIPDWYFVCLINSTFISEYDFNFVNNTQTFQINDARQLPIIIPTAEQLKQFEEIYNRAYQIQKLKFKGKISKVDAEAQLDMVQSKVDNLVYQLYGLTEEEIRIVECV